MGDAEAHVRSLLLRDLGTVLHIQDLESTNIEDSNRVEVNALFRADNNQDPLLEQIIGRLSLEPLVTSVRWRYVTSDDGDKDY
jgi:putative Mg2+ transporter-C (MgtC) family protein